MDSPGTVLGFVPLPNKVVGIVRLIILYHPVTGFGLVQRTYRLIYALKKCYFQISYPPTRVKSSSRIRLQYVFVSIVRRRLVRDVRIRAYQILCSQSTSAANC